MKPAVSLLLSDHVDGTVMVLGGRHWVLVAGLVVELGFHQVIAGGGDDAGLDDEFASVDA